MTARRRLHPRWLAPAGLALGLALGAAHAAPPAPAAAAAARPFAPRAARTLPPGLHSLPAAQTGLTGTNRFDDPRMWGERFREFTLGALETGIAIADVDGDGRLDLYVVSKTGPCALYLQTGPLQFTDTAATAGVAAADSLAPKVGATFVDLNQDGAPDLYVCRHDAPNLLFLNRGDGTFTEQAAAWGLAVRDASVHATFADYDGDGDLDCYLVTNILDFAQNPLGRRDYLLRQEPGHTFTDVSAAAGIWGFTQGHTALWFDANQDGWPDLYVANDFETPDRFYLNRGDGTFTDVVDQWLPHVTYFSMGADAGDVNNDGRPDFLVADMRDRTRAEFLAGMEEAGRGLWERERPDALIPQYAWNTLYLGTGAGRYQEAAHLAGFAATGWTWAARLADLDQDGRQDAFFTAGMIRNFIDADRVDRENTAPSLAGRAALWRAAPPRRETPLAYRNLDGLHFADVSATWGLDLPGVHFGCALADLDGDGDLDAALASLEGPPVLLRNDAATGHSLQIRLAGRAPNRDGLGAELLLETAAGLQLRQLYTERGIVASEPAVAHFGLGAETTARRLTIRWPSGGEQVLTDLAADQIHLIAEPVWPAGTRRGPARLAPGPDPAVRFTETARAAGLDHASTGRPVDEFLRQRLLPRRLGRPAPALATADVNADGRPDLFITGSTDEPGRLWLATPAGTFTPAPAQPWAADRAADDTGAVFLDYDGDGAPDLFVAAGGAAAPAGDPLLDDRLYHNDGRGRFTLAPAGTLPRDGTATTAAATADFDGDGHADLFVGGRFVAGAWPEAPRSFLYRNVGGRFEDVTAALAPDLLQAGLVTAAAWADVDGDGRPDLVLATEWGPVRLFRNTGATPALVETTAAAGLAGVTGQWRALLVADVDGDGRPDLVAGNTGLNTKYRASPAAPAVLLAGVLDSTGRRGLLEAASEEGQLRPVRGRSKLAYTFPWLPAKFPTFRAFANASLDQIFDPALLAQATRLEITELASGVFHQQPDGTFRFAALPPAAQLAPINTLAWADLGGGGPELFVAGNDFGPEPSTGRFDGGVGLLLRPDGRGGFIPVSPATSGLIVPGEARSVAVLPGAPGGNSRLAVAQSGGPLLLFAPRAP